MLWGAWFWLADFVLTPFAGWMHGVKYRDVRNNARPSERDRRSHARIGPSSAECHS